MARALAMRGRRLPYRNAVREGVRCFAPIIAESAVFSAMMTALGKRRSKGPAVEAMLGPSHLQRISEAAGRLRAEMGEAPIPLPFTGD